MAVTLETPQPDKHLSGLGEEQKYEIKSDLAELDYFRFRLRNPTEFPDKTVSLYPFGDTADFRGYIDARPLFAQTFGAGFINPVTQSVATTIDATVKRIPHTTGIGEFDVRNAFSYDIRAAEEDGTFTPLATEKFAYRRSEDQDLEDQSRLIAAYDTFDSKSLGDGVDQRNRIKRIVFDGQYIPIVFYSSRLNPNNLIEVDVEFPTADGENLTPHFGVLYAFWAVATGAVTVRIKNTGTIADFNVDLIYYNRTAPHKKILYWYTRSGGWDWYCFNDLEGTRRAEKQSYKRRTDNYGSYKTEVKSLNSYTEAKLFGIPATREFCGHLRGIVESPHVIDETGAEVEVLNSSIMFDADGILEPTVTIRYKDQRTINL